MVSICSGICILYFYVRFYSKVPLIGMPSRLSKRVLSSEFVLILKPSKNRKKLLVTENICSY